MGHPSFMIPLSFPDNRHHDLPLPRLDVAFQVEDLLPGAQDELAVADRHGQVRAEPTGLQVRVAVAVVPGLLVAVVAAGRDQLVQQSRAGPVAARARTRSCRRTPVLPTLNTWAMPVRMPDAWTIRATCVGDVVHVAVARRADGDLVLVVSSVYSFRPPRLRIYLRDGEHRITGGASALLARLIGGRLQYRRAPQAAEVKYRRWPLAGFHITSTHVRYANRLQNEAASAGGLSVVTHPSAFILRPFL